MRRWLAATLIGASSLLSAEEFPLYEAEVDVFQVERLRRGAKVFVDRCFGCHSLKLMRYRRLQRDLRLSDEEMRELFPGLERISGVMENAFDPEEAERWLGAAPPDLSTKARARGADWIYTFLLTFYRDDRRPSGVNNAVLVQTVMPHVLWDIEGLKRPIIKEHGSLKAIKGFTHPKGGKLSPEAYRQLVADLTTFLVYASEPARLERVPLGKWVLLFLVLLSFILYRLKRFYWQDVK